MGASLVSELLEAGLITSAQLRSAGISAESAEEPDVRLVERLVDEGLDEGALAGFFVSRGLGPVLEPEQLARADADLLERFPAESAHAFCALPVRNSTAGVVLAMATPSDEAAVRAIEDLICDAVLPTATRLSDLKSALRQRYPEASPAPMSAAAEPAASPSKPSKPTKVASVSPKSSPAVSRPPMSKPPISKLPGLSLSALVEKTSPAWDRAWEAVPQSALTSLYAPSNEESERANADLSRARARFAMAQSRDELVQLACEACLKVARAAAFLALRKGVLRGWHAAGDEVDLASIQSLWVPASNPSTLSEVVETGTAFRGPYGQTAADHLFRAALGGQGRQVAIAPVLIGERLIGLLCANDPLGPPDAVAQIAAEVGEALQRMLAARKT